MYVLETAPNPFKESTTISYTLPANTQNAGLIITNATGQQVKRYDQITSDNQITFESEYLKVGMYFCTLVVEGQKMATVKIFLTE